MGSMDISRCLEALSTRLIDASAIAKAAVTCARSGSDREAVRIVLLNEAQTLHGAVCLLDRMDWQETASPS